VIFLEMRNRIDLSIKDRYTIRKLWKREENAEVRQQCYDDDQITYQQIIKLKRSNSSNGGNQDSSDRRFETLQSDESRNS
jgi:hypothetical protein